MRAAWTALHQLHVRSSGSPQSYDVPMSAPLAQSLSTCVSSRFLASVFCIGVAQSWKASPGICYGTTLAFESHRMGFLSRCPLCRGSSVSAELAVASHCGSKTLLAQGSRPRMAHRHAVLSTAAIVPSALAGLLALLSVLWFALKGRGARE